MTLRHPVYVCLHLFVTSQCVAVRCKHTACCSVLQRVAVCYSVLQSDVNTHVYQHACLHKHTCVLESVSAYVRGSEIVRMGRGGEGMEGVYTYISFTHVRNTPPPLLP